MQKKNKLSSQDTHKVPFLDFDTYKVLNYCFDNFEDYEDRKEYLENIKSQCELYIRNNPFNELSKDKYEAVKKNILQDGVKKYNNANLYLKGIDEFINLLSFENGLKLLLNKKSLKPGKVKQRSKKDLQVEHYTSEIKTAINKDENIFYAIEDFFNEKDKETFAKMKELLSGEFEIKNISAFSRALFKLKKPKPSFSNPEQIRNRFNK